MDWIKKTEISQEMSTRLKTEIDETIKNNKIPNSTLGKSTTGVNSKQFNLFEYKTNLSKVIDCINPIVENHLKLNGLLKSENSLKITSMWTVLGNEGCFHTIHNHNKRNINHISTVTYLEISKNNIFQPGSFFSILKGPEENTVFEHHPNKGDILIFPVWVLHGTYPQGRGLRQTLNIDFAIN